MSIAGTPEEAIFRSLSVAAKKYAREGALAVAATICGFYLYNSYERGLIREQELTAKNLLAVREELASISFDPIKDEATKKEFDGKVTKLKEKIKVLGDSGELAATLAAAYNLELDGRNNAPSADAALNTDVHRSGADKPELLSEVAALKSAKSGLDNPTTRIRSIEKISELVEKTDFVGVLALKTLFAASTAPDDLTKTKTLLVKFLEKNPEQRPLLEEELKR